MKTKYFMHSIRHLLILLISLYARGTIFSQSDTFPIKFKIDPLSIKKVAEEKELFENIDYIKLETNKHCLIGNVSNVLIANDRIFALSSSTGLVYCFSKDGKYLFTLNKRGLAPKETGEILDISMSLENRQIFLSDHDKRSIFVYDFDGKFIDKHKFDFFVEDIIFINNSLIAIKSSESKGMDIKIYDIIKRKVIFEKIKLYPLEEISVGMNMFSALNNSTIFSPPLRDTIFTVTSQDIKPKYIIDFGKHALPKEIKAKDGRISYYTLRNKNKSYAGLISHAWETSNYLVFLYSYSKMKDQNQVIIDKNSNKVKQFNAISIGNFIIPTSHNLFRSSHNVSYGIIYPVNITSETNIKQSIYGRFKKINDFITKTSANDNPIIMIYTLKSKIE